MTGSSKFDRTIDPGEKNRNKTDACTHITARNESRKTRSARLFTVIETPGNSTPPSRESNAPHAGDTAIFLPSHARRASVNSPANPITLGLSDGEGPLWIFDVLCDLANVADRENLRNLGVQIELAALALSRDLKVTIAS